MTQRVAVVPTLRRDPEQLTVLCRALEGAGLTPRLVVNGRLLHEALASQRVEHVDTKDNAGFGSSVRAGVEGVDWEWLAIVNDDITISAEGVGGALRELWARSSSDLILANLDPGARRTLPTVTSVLSSVSMWATASGRIRRAAPQPIAPGHGYKSFSFVVISRGLWDALDGLDPRYVHTYEDSDFVRRAQAVGAEILDLDSSGVHHEGSGTGRSHLDAVLPVGVYSAWQYLCALGQPSLKARLLLSLALLARVPMVPVTRAPMGAHLRGIARSLHVLLTGSRPRLPRYEDC